jgi:hypothetical protein
MVEVLVLAVVGDDADVKTKVPRGSAVAEKVMLPAGNSSWPWRRRLPKMPPVIATMAKKQTVMTTQADQKR